MGVVWVLVLCAEGAGAWEFPENPDRFASIGLHRVDTWQKGFRDEVDYNNLGQEVRVNGGDEKVSTSEFGFDLRVPIHPKCTLEGGYSILETDSSFVRRDGVFKESRELDGYRASIGVRFYMN